MADVVLAAVPTPFAADGSLDLGCARRLYAFLADRADGLLVAGTTGEFPALDEDERLALIDTAIEVLGPDRIIAHIGAPDAYRAVRLAREASLLGASRIAAITPYYLAASPAEVTEYYLRIREAAPEPGLYAYIFPERTGLTVAPQQFCELADAVGLAGAKFSGVAARNVAECAAALPGVRIFSGDDSDLAATLRTGGAGIISARTSAFPEVFSGLSATIAATAGGTDGDTDRDGEVAARQADVSAIAGLGQSIGLVKEALRVRGFGPMAARMAVAEPDAATAARVAELVKSLAADD